MWRPFRLGEGKGNLEGNQRAFEYLWQLADKKAELRDQPRPE
jgi:hypothetical protein